MSSDLQEIALNNLREKFKGECTSDRIINVQSPSDLTLVNRLFGSSSTVIELKGSSVCSSYGKVVPFWRYNDRLHREIRSGLDRLIVEDWVVNEPDHSFQSKMSEEVRVLENTIMSLMIYQLGGFSFPKDHFREKAQELFKIDVWELLRKPRLIFLLGGFNIRFILRYCYWKTSFVLDGFMRSVGTSKVKDPENHWINVRNSL